jgi:hypothetical protein
MLGGDSTDGGKQLDAAASDDARVVTTAVDCGLRVSGTFGPAGVISYKSTDIATAADGPLDQPIVWEGERPCLRFTEGCRVEFSSEWNRTLPGGSSECMKLGVQWQLGTIVKCWCVRPFVATACAVA